MAVTPPSTANRIDTSPAGVFRPGAAVTATPAQDLLENHNHLWSALGAPIGHGAYGSGWTGGGGSYVDLQVFRRPADVDRRPVTLSVIRENVGGSSGNLRVIDGSTTIATTSISAGAAEGVTTFSWTPGSDGPATVYLQCDYASIKVYASEFSRDTFGGVAVSDDTPRPSGFAFAQPSQLATDEPVTVEHFNRMLAAPHQIYRAPALVGGFADAPAAPRLGFSENTYLTINGIEGVAAGTKVAPQGWVFLSLRHRARVRATATGRLIYGGDGIVQMDAPGGTWRLTFASTTTPAAGGSYTWVQSDTVELEPGIHPVAVSLIGAELWTLQFLTEPLT